MTPANTTALYTPFRSAPHTDLPRLHDGYRITNLESKIRDPYSISVVVPVHNGGERFRRCLDALTEARPAPSEIIVVVDGGSDGSWHYAAERGVRLIRHDVARGPAYARNAGARAASGSFLFFVDADVVVPPDVFERIGQTLKASPDLTTLIGSYCDSPGESDFLSQYRNLLHHYTHQTSSELAMTFWGACGVVRRDIFFAVGGFDESFTRPCVEDIELGYRLSHFGHRIRLQKDLQVTHLKRWTVQSMVRTDIFDRAIPWTELILKRNRIDNDLNLRLTSRLSAAALLTQLLALTVFFWYSPVGVLAFVMAVLIFVLNAPFYGFLYRKRGVLFTLKALPWHWFYHAYSSLAFAAGLVRFYAGGSKLKIKRKSVTATSFHLEET